MSTLLHIDSTRFTGEIKRGTTSLTEIYVRLQKIDAMFSIIQENVGNSVWLIEGWSTHSVYIAAYTRPL
jgi:hypothetical protein